MPRGLVSPDMLFKEAKKVMLKGKEPVTPIDWMKVFNFIAYNISDGLELPATKLMAKIFGAPLSDEDIEKIVNFQVELKEKELRAKARRN